MPSDGSNGRIAVVSVISGLDIEEDLHGIGRPVIGPLYHLGFWVRPLDLMIRLNLQDPFLVSSGFVSYLL